MLDLDALANLDRALAELSGERPVERLSSLAREIIAGEAPAPQCPHLARIAAE
ncbi:MAG: hypothetical protein AAF479_15540 [Pseudomonadota bacterium]